MLAKKAVAYRFGSPSRRETTGRPDRKANETLRNFPTEPETRTLKGSEKYSRLEKSIDQRYRSSLSRFASSIEAATVYEKLQIPMRFLSPPTVIYAAIEFSSFDVNERLEKW